jgi:hypothetical protein
VPIARIDAETIYNLGCGVLSHPADGQGKSTLAEECFLSLACCLA